MCEQLNNSACGKVYPKQFQGRPPVISTKKIDEIDAKIIKELLKDARRNFADIAKECHVSTTTISDHFNELEKAGVIRGSTIQMNYKSFGYDAVADIMVKVEPGLEKQVVEYIQRMPNIYCAFPIYDSKYNLKVVATLKNLKELDQVKDAIRQQKSVEYLSTHLWTGIRNMPENLAIPPFQQKTGSNNKTIVGETKVDEKTENKIDETDAQIVKKLAENSREAFRKIAEQIGISTDTVARRYKKLTQDGIIKATLQIDPTKIGYHANAYFNIAVSSEKDSLTIAEKLTKIPDLFLIIKTSGDYDMFFAIMIRDIDQLLAVQEEVTRIPGVIRMQSSVNEAPDLFLSPCQYISTF
jgi:Lrp/AsnC family transcriptional regulator for asnA, asnC and gidA